MWHARTQAGRARVLGAALVGLCAWSGEATGPMQAAAGPAQSPRRVRVAIEVVAEHERDGPITQARVSAQRIDEPRPAIEVEVSGAGGSIELEPGVWSLIARAPGRLDRQWVFTLPAPQRGSAGPAPLRFTLPLVRVPVVLQLGPPGAIAAGATWTLAREGSEWGEMFPGDDAREELSLEPGRWRGSVAAPGFVTQEFAWTIGEAAPVIVLRPVAPPPVVAPPRPPAPREPDPRLELGLGLGLAGAASLGLGVGLLVRHREGYAHFDAAPNNAAFVAALGASSAGAGLVGSGLGLGVAALTAGLSFGDPAGKSGAGRGSGRGGGRKDGALSTRDRVLWAELAVGGGLALIGAAWYAREWQDVQKDLYDGDKDPDMDGTPSGHDPKSQRRETAAASFIGAGAGLMVGAGVALLVRNVLRIRGRGPDRSRAAKDARVTNPHRASGANGSSGASWALAGGPGQFGLGLRGRF